MIELFNLPIGIQVIDSEMRYVFLNEKILNQVNKTLKDHLGKRMEEVYPGIDQSEVYQAIKECHNTGLPKRVHNEFVMPDESLSYWELDIKKVKDEVVIFSRDITESKNGEILLLNSNVRLEKQIEVKTAELTKSNQKYRDLISQLSHDLRGPLVSIKGLIELVESGDVEKKEAEGVMVMVKDMTNSLLSLLRKILDDSALSSGKIQLEKAPHNLYEVFEKRLSTLQKVGDLDEYDVVVHAEKDIVKSFDEVRIIQVIDNLLSNAIRYSVPSSSIDVTINNDGVFSIKNQIDQEKVKYAEAANKVDTSVGFGQEIIKYILEGHNTKLSIKQSDGLYEASFQLSD